MDKFAFFYNIGYNMHKEALDPFSLFLGLTQGIGGGLAASSAKLPLKAAIPIGLGLGGMGYLEGKLLEKSMPTTLEAFVPFFKDKSKKKKSLAALGLGALGAGSIAAIPYARNLARQLKAVQSLKKEIDPQVLKKIKSIPPKAIKNITKRVMKKTKLTQEEIADIYKRSKNPFEVIEEMSREQSKKYKELPLIQRYLFEKDMLHRLALNAAKSIGKGALLGSIPGSILFFGNL
ncbi:MAG: hypothetical protein ABIM30_00690 [candidate division WOR-3 bacterium]